MKNKIQLITYVDRLGCKSIQDLNSLFKNEFKGLFGGLHILPFYYPIDGEDAGFDPIDHNLIDPRLGDWNDLNELSKEVDIMADLIVNHVSAKSVQFQDYLQKGKESKYASLFLTYDTVFPNGATEADLLTIYRPRPNLPFTMVKLNDGSTKLIWTTFTSNQIDIDVKSDIGIQYLEGILDTFQKGGVKMIRLDAAGYAIKQQGTSCFMIDETYEFIDKLTEKAKAKGIEVLVEIHSYYKTQIEIAKRVDYVYDFALPVLVLDTLFNKNASSLKKWLEVSPKNALTVLDTHDGIGIVDVAAEGNKPGLIEGTVLSKIVDQIHVNSKGNSLKATGAAASNLDLYQVNCTYFDALGRDENAYLMARAIQFFVPGIPQVYYVGLFAGENDMELLEKTNVGRDINRHYFTKNEINEHLKRPLINDLAELMFLRNNHKAFNGDFNLIETEENKLNIKWVNDRHIAELFIDLTSMKMETKFSL
ncbi:sucrose phosphorylase [Lutibacter oceani]|uniref:Sucrose phosphorylase n=1 Tax=Lutibacter oceani TaxID=1853311 RepID=A0A3D9RST7_9FLAO|nr:sucrose phosphorylase [Lutibacter oceani]REE83000.1 sucrose phosphorylase [Lutibacter oceani]